MVNPAPLFCKLIPVPGYGAGVLTLEGNLAGYIDRIILPGRLIQGIFDENGLVTDIPAISLVHGCDCGERAGIHLQYRLVQEPSQPGRHPGGARRRAHA